MDLPAALAQQLRGFERRLCALETAAALLGGAAGILLTYLALFLSDRLWDTPPGLRILFTGGSGLGCAAAAAVWTRFWLWRRRDTRELARLVQRRFSRLGDRLLGAVELANGENVPAGVSPALCRAAIQQVAQEAARYDFTQAVNRRRTRWLGAACVGLAALAAVPAFLFPQAGRNTLSRWLQPFKPVARYTFVRLADLPARQVVPHGEPFEIACVLDPASRWQPVSASCRFENQPRLDARISGGCALFKLPGQTHPGTLTIRIGDVARDIAIVPVFRPELVAVTADVTPPAYLQRPAARTAIAGGAARFVEGSLVALTGRANRPLSAASVERDAARTPLAVKAEAFATEPRPAGHYRLSRFTWTDTYGLTGAAPYDLDIATEPDAAPTVECRAAGRSIAILEDEAVTFETAAADDYGLRNLWLEWNLAADPRQAAAGTAVTTGTVTLATGGSETRTLEAPYTFSPVALHVPEESTVQLVARSVDYFPGRVPTTSRPCRIYVLSRAQHARLVEQQMQQVQARLEDLAREEERLEQANSELRKQPPEQATAERRAAALRENEQAERENARNLDQLARDVAGLTKEALRNRDIGEQTLARWNEMALSMEQTAQGDMQQAAGALQEARTTPEPQGQDQKLDKAVAAEQRALEAMRAMESGINKSLEQMAAQNFINRLRAAAGKERGLAGAVREIQPQALGLEVAQLPPAARAVLDQSAAQQDENRTQTGNIAEDLAGFFNRTREEIYQAIAADMADKHVVDAMTQVAGGLRANRIGEVLTEAGRIEQQLTAWADRLDAAQQQGGGGGGGGGGDNQRQVDVETLLALMRLRVQEEALREHTRQLDRGRDANPAYEADSRRLGDKQGELAQVTRPLERRARDAEVRRFIEKIGGEMQNTSMFLRRPQTDQETIAVQTEIIELIARAINSTSKQQSQSLAQSLQQQMGLSRSGGGSNQGGTTDRANAAAGGQPGGAGGEAHEVQKTGGADPGLPEEYREALEAYFHQVEEKP